MTRTTRTIISANALGAVALVTPVGVTCVGNDPKAPPALRLSKAELEALAKLPLCSTEQTGEMCVMVDRALYDKAPWIRFTNGALPPAWVQNYDECVRRQLEDPSGSGGSYDGGRDRPLHTP